MGRQVQALCCLGRGMVAAALRMGSKSINDKTLEEKFQIQYFPMFTAARMSPQWKPCRHVYFGAESILMNALVNECLVINSVGV